MNRVKTILLSSPRAVAQSSHWIVDEIVGKRNIIRQNVDGDPVPVIQDSVESPFKSALLSVVQALGGNHLISKIPQFKPVVQEGSLASFTGLRGVGFLALDTAPAAIGRAGHFGHFKAPLAPLHYGQSFHDNDSGPTTRFSPEAIGNGDNIDELLVRGAERQGPLRAFYEGGIGGAALTVVSGAVDICATLGTASLQVTAGIAEASVPLLQGVSAGSRAAYANFSDVYQRTQSAQNSFEVASIVVPGIVKAAANLTWETTKGATRASLPFLKRTTIAATELAKGTVCVLKKAVKASAQIGVALAKGLKQVSSWLWS